MVANDERACPVCAKTIKMADDVCQHCGHRFRGRDPASKPVRQPPTPSQHRNATTGAAPPPMTAEERNRLLKIIGAVAGVAILIVVLATFAGFQRKPVTSGSSSVASSTEVQNEEASPTEEELAALIAEDAISTYGEADRKTYPKLFEKLGNRVFEVGGLGKQAALLALKTGKCDKVVYVDVSDTSTRDELQFFVDCADETRVRISESEIRQGNATNVVTKAQRDEGIAARAVQHEGLVADAKEQVKKSLRDPSSAEFGPITISEKDGVAACGTVNARNGFGGMSGQQPFVAFRDGISMPTDRDFEQIWKRYCAF